MFEVDLEERARGGVGENDPSQMLTKLIKSRRPRKDLDEHLAIARRRTIDVLAPKNIGRAVDSGSF